MSTQLFELSDDVIPPGRALEAVYATAYMLLEAGDLAAATRAFRVMVRFAPTDERSWLGLGYCHELLGDDEVAVEIFGAGGLVNGSARCMLAAGRVARRCGDADVARARLDDALVLADESDDAELAAMIAAERGHA